MSLIRRIRLLLLSLLVLAVGGAVLVNLASARATLQAQVRLKNADNAQSLALVLTQLRGERGAMELALAAFADTGHYARVRFEPADATAPIERRFDPPATAAPGWFRALLPIASEPGVAQVSDGWRALGRVVVVTHVAHAHASLWQGGLQALLWMAIIGGLGALAAGGVLRALEAPLDATVRQAEALAEGRHLTNPEPAVPELRRLVAAMNAMVERVRRQFEREAGETERWRRQAHCDALTGLAHRAHFIERLQALLAREDGVPGGVLLLLRLADLEALNRDAGRAGADRTIAAAAAVLAAAAGREPGAVAGRLNGRDFALFLPQAADAAARGQALAAALQAAVAAVPLRAYLGATTVAAGQAGPALLARADEALARAELGAPFTLVLEASPQGIGEQAWRARLLAALRSGSASLAEYPVLAADGSLHHLECPLRLVLDLGGAPVPAAHWLPMAVRTHTVPAVDLCAVQLALRACAADGRRRGVNVAGASLADPGFVPALRECLRAAGPAASRLRLELPESAALERFDALAELVAQLRPLGVRVGLEHAGDSLHRVPRLYELGLDLVKLDAAACAGVAERPQAQAFVRAAVRLLAPLGIEAGAEGVASEADAQALRACGVAVLTGPWAGGAT